MSSKRGIVAVALAALMVLSVVGPALAAAQTQEDDTTDDGGDLTVDVREGGSDAVLVVVSSSCVCAAASAGPTTDSTIRAARATATIPRFELISSDHRSEPSIKGVSRSGRSPTFAFSLERLREI